MWAYKAAAIGLHVDFVNRLQQDEQVADHEPTLFDHHLTYLIGLRIHIGCVQVVRLLALHLDGGSGAQGDLLVGQFSLHFPCPIQGPIFLDQV